MVFLHSYYLWLTTLSHAVFATSRSIGIPTVPFTSSDEGSYPISSLRGVLVDSKLAESRDESGETLIPPSLQEFAKTFADDLHDVLGLDISVSPSDEPISDTVFLTLGDPSKYTDVKGSQTSEGYTLSVDSSGIVITGASPLGVWWGTRTVLQQAVLSNGSLSYGEADDAPGWRTRGMALDAARHYYPPEFIIELCSYMSFFKQNTFQIHLSDNLYNNVNLYTREQSLELYARFRLWSDSEELAGLNKYKNESYTREQFEEIQTTCASRGVTIIPEIEAPGHALVIVQWKPELGLEGELSLLNISHPDSIPTVKTIWSTFLDWFHVKTVHIGADEYTGDPNDYNLFVNEMADYIYQESGKSIRIWGTFPPKPEYSNIYTNVSIQHWTFSEDDPYHDYILNNYSVLNSDDTYYTVLKYHRSYPQVVNVARTFNGDPAAGAGGGGGGIWQPHVFDTKTAANNPERSNPLVLGAVTPLWNDFGANASVFSEAYYAWRDGIPALADKQWGGDLSAAEFAAAFAALQPFAPAQNLDRAIPSVGSTVFNYTTTITTNTTTDSSSSCSSNSALKSHYYHFTSLEKRTDTTIVVDHSGNGYDAIATCPLTSASASDSTAIPINSSCSLVTPLSSKGRNYTLSLRLLVSSFDADATATTTLLSGRDSALMLTPNLTLFASGNYYRLNTTVPLGSWFGLDVVGRGNRTFARVRAEQKQQGAGEGGEGEEGKGKEKEKGEEEEFQAVLGVNGVSLVWAPIAIEAPLERVGGEGAGWTGLLAAMSLSSEA
ncbi:glycoside hydrolase family 20 protein [Daldinia caldariorum]|uniref:glycoside hydrolase family 20 protein n=1 Tax=Daldinia caldariorum TaxID=326644 RepID=UPI002007DE03|nr:glycoside hydrolase family 20 protein [Daldinia caldariorum]KAI1464703.1 glycoside hydrolase family 20 protein [Daldinia caldariorum]